MTRRHMNKAIFWGVETILKVGGPDLMGSARTRISSEFGLSVLATASFFKGFGICTSRNGLLWYSILENHVE